MRRRFLQTVASSASQALLWLLPFALQADDWPQWRGPNRDGVWTE